MKYRLLFWLACWLCTGYACAQTYRSHTWQNQTLEIETSAGYLRLVPMTERIVEVTYVSPNPLRRAPDTSHAVILRPQLPKASIQNTKQTLTLQVRDMSVQINKVGEIALVFSYKQQPKIQQNGALFRRDTLQGFQFTLDSQEALFGTGTRALPMNRRGKRLLLYNAPHYSYEENADRLNYGVPVVLSSKNYMLFFDNATKSYLDLGATDADKLSFEGLSTGKKTYYFIAGEQYEDILESYTQLTGRQPMPPQWAMGNFASRYGYRSEEETRKMIQAFEQQEIPVSAVVLDHYWYGAGEIKKSVAMGDLDWYKPTFPTGEQMVRDFRAKGIETVLITQPFVLTASKNFAEAEKKRLFATDKHLKTMIPNGFYFGETALLDIFKPETQEWYWQHYKRLISQGAVGVWGDLGEPEVHPDGIFHLDGKARAQEFHNIYGHYWAKMIHEGFRRDFPRLRPFILMRSGFAGSQRFGLIPWSGDVAHSWGGLRAQPSLALSMGLCGIAYMHSDAGGFAGGTKDDELYIRWLQYSLFQPIFRPHSQEQVPAEPVLYDEPTKSIARELVRWRYRLLPYNQSLAYENSLTGKPLMRPIWAEEPDNKELFDVADTYFWGKDFVVAPVLHQGAKNRRLYLPKNALWYDFLTGDVQKNGWIDAKLEYEWLGLGYFPVYVRGGACLLTAPDDRLAQKYDLDKFNLTYYMPSKDAKLSNIPTTYYLEKPEKDGSVREAGIIQLKNERAGKLELQARVPAILQSPENGFLGKNRTISFVIRGLEQPPAQLILNGKPLVLVQMQEAKRGDAYWHPSRKEVQCVFEWKAGEKTTIEWR